MSPNNSHLRQYACPVLEMGNLTRKSARVHQAARESARGPWGLLTSQGQALPRQSQ